MNSSPFARLPIVRHLRLVAAIYPACVWATNRPGLDGIRGPTPMYIHEVDASKPPSGSVVPGPT
jgi:hypothetical protein